MNQPPENLYNRGSKILHSVVHLILLLVISDDLINTQPAESLACLVNLKFFFPLRNFDQEYVCNTWPVKTLCTTSKWEKIFWSFGVALLPAI